MLLEQKGWELGETGIREKVIGGAKVKLEFELTLPKLSFLEEAAREIKDAWSKIGAKTNIIVVEPQEITDGALRTRSYQMLLFGNIIRNRKDLFAFWHSGERFYPGSNLSVYENNIVDTALEKIRKEFKAENSQTEFKKIIETITKDRPAIFLFSPNYLYATNKKLSGWTEQSIVTGSDRFLNIEQWYIKTKRIWK